MKNSANLGGYYPPRPSWIIQEREISQREVPPDFFLKLTFHMNKTFKTWVGHVSVPYANEEKSWPNMAQALVSDRLR